MQYVFLLGTRRDQQRAYFIGGSPELEDMIEMVQPNGFTGKALNKYGFKTEASGRVKVCPVGHGQLQE
jgi:hypothetical protein